jgi:hypothetical protein
MKYMCFVLLVSIIACTTNNGNQFVNGNDQETLEYNELNSFDIDMVNYMDYYYFTDDWYGYTGDNGKFLGGKIIVHLILCDFNENDNTIKIEIQKDMTGFGEVILQRTIAVKKEEKYEFEFIDGWENKAFGNFVFNKDGTITFYLDCKEFSDYGKNIGRLYGDTYVLQKGELEFN